MDPQELKSAIGKLSIFGWVFPAGLKEGEVPSSVLSPDGKRYSFIGAMAAWAAEHEPALDAVARQSLKHETLSRLLDVGLVRLVVDASDDSVIVPTQFLGNQCLALNLSKNFKNPIKFTDYGIMTELSFGGKSCMCVIPWGAMRGAISHVTHEECVWEPEPVTPEVLTFMGDVEAVMAKRPKKSSPPTLGPLSTTIERFEAFFNEIENLEDAEADRIMQAMIRAGNRAKRKRG